MEIYNDNTFDDHDSDNDYGFFCEVDSHQISVCPQNNIDNISSIKNRRLMLDINNPDYYYQEDDDIYDFDFELTNEEKYNNKKFKYMNIYLNITFVLTLFVSGVFIYKIR
jgi:hypothetical protein